MKFKILEELIIEHMEEQHKLPIGKRGSYLTTLHNYVHTNLFETKEVARWIKNDVVNKFETGSGFQLVDDKVKACKFGRYGSIGLAVIGALIGNLVFVMSGGILYALNSWKLSKLKSTLNKDNEEAGNPALNYYKNISDERWAEALENLKPKIKETLESYKTD